MLPALHTCLDGHSVPILARIRHASRSSYVPGRPQCSHPGTYQACFPLFIRARTATAFPSRHVPGMLPTLHTCPGSHSTRIPARTRHASRSIYVPGQPQCSNPGTYQACFPRFLRAGAATAFQAREGENSCSDKTNHRLLIKPVVCSGNGDSSKCLVMVNVFKKYASGYSIMSPVLALVIRLISGSKR